MKKRTALISILASMILVAGVGACRHGHHHGGFDEFDLEAATKRIASHLDLTEYQKADLERIAAEIASKAKTLHEDRQARHQEVADLVRQDTISPEVADEMIAERFDRMKEMVDYAAERLVAFHATLTPEQREKVAERIEAHAAGRHGMFGH